MTLLGSTRSSQWRHSQAMGRQAYAQRQGMARLTASGSLQVEKCRPAACHGALQDFWGEYQHYLCPSKEVVAYNVVNVICA